MRAKTSMPTVRIAMPSVLAGIASVLDIFGVLGAEVPRTTARYDRQAVADDFDAVREDLETAWHGVG